VTRLICTHFHPDHMGLAGWLTQRWASSCGPPRPSGCGAHDDQDDDNAGFAADQAPFYRRTGIDEPTVAAITAGGNG